MARVVVNSFDVDEVVARKKRLIQELNELAVRVQNFRRVCFYELEDLDSLQAFYLTVQNGMITIESHSATDYGVFETEYSGEKLESVPLHILERAISVLQKEVLKKERGGGES